MVLSGYMTGNEIRYKGIDRNFVDLLFFKDTDEKNNYIKEVEETVNQLDISKPMDMTDFLEKVNRHEGGPVFLKQALNYQNFTVMRDSNGNVMKTMEMQHKEGIDKLYYYDRMSVFQYNVDRKIEEDVTDFEAEENWLNENLSEEFMNYSRIDALFAMGTAFNQVGNDAKRDEYFNRIRGEKYEVSEATVSKFYKEIASIYSEKGDLQKSLEWLKAGIALNPKLAVKKQIANLEKHLGITQ